MNFVFTTCRLVMGGNETLILRMSEWLLSEGHSVTVIAAQGGYLADKMPKGCNVIVVGSFRFGAAVIPFFNYDDDIKEIFKQADVVMSFSGGGCMFAYHLYKRFSPKSAKLISGVFHPNTGVSEVSYFNSIFWNAVFNENKFYMNKAISEEHAQKGYDTENTKLWTLPVIIDRKSDNLSIGFDSNIILSIGRLTEFKGYNYYMIDVVKELVNQGFKNIEWHVIGDDEPNTREPVKKYMQSKIIEYGLQDNIMLHGIIDYKELPKFINKSKVFVGMGTSAVEACACGVPTICAVVDEKEGYTYGYMWDQPKGCVGEKLLNTKPDIKVLDLIKNLLLLNESDYQKMSTKALNVTEDFLLENQMKEFMSLLISSKPGLNRKPPGRIFHIIKKMKNKLSFKL